MRSKLRLRLQDRPRDAEVLSRNTAKVLATTQGLSECRNLLQCVEHGALDDPALNGSDYNRTGLAVALWYEHTLLGREYKSSLLQLTSNSINVSNDSALELARLPSCFTGFR
jgi:hypothetical protein